MFIDSTTGKRVNIYAAFVTEDGVRYTDLTNSQVRQELNIVEIDEPAPPQGYVPDEYFRTEQDDAPYVIYTRKEQSIIDKEFNDRILAQIEALEIDSKMNRTVREQMLEIAVERAAAKFNVSLEQAATSLYQGNVAFKRFKDLDDQIAALRAQLRPT